MPSTLTAKGASWLLEETPSGSVFTPERLTEEHKLIGQTTDEFMTNEVLPAIDRLEQKDWGLARDLMRRAGDLGLLATDVPEEFGGVGADKTSSIIVAERTGRSGSFSAT